MKRFIHIITFTVLVGSICGAQIDPVANFGEVIVSGGYNASATWSLSEINASTSGFGVVWINGGDVEATVSIDAFRRTVTYTEAGGGARKRVVGYGGGRTEIQTLN